MLRRIIFCGEFYGGVGAGVRNFAGMEANDKERKERRGRLQLAAALAVCALGCALLVAGFVVEPPGQIHQSVLVGFGECLTFGGSLLGIDYKYRIGSK